MRPRGESISLLRTLYVGQWFRQSPQCTQVESSSQLGRSLASAGFGCTVCACASIAVVSDNESTSVQNVLWINGPLYCAHHVHISRGGAPDVKVQLGFNRTLRDLSRRSGRQHSAKRRNAVGILHG